MSDVLCVAPGCSRPRPGHAFLCNSCTGRLERNLADVPALWRELEVTLTRQDAIGSDGGRPSADTGLPFKPNASEAREILANVVGTWARLIAEHAGISQPPARPARWLSLNVQTIAMHPAADEAYDEIADAVRQAYRAIDRMPDLLLAGECEACNTGLYARPGDDTVTCKDCDIDYQASERHDAMIDAARIYPVPATVALSWIGKFLGHSIPRGTWDSWTSRRRIFVHGVDAEGRPTYLFGDAWDLAEQWLTWQEQRRAKKGAA